MRRDLGHVAAVVRREPSGIVGDASFLALSLGTLWICPLALLLAPLALTQLYQRVRRAAGAADGEVDPNLGWFFQAPGAFLFVVFLLHQLPLLVAIVVFLGVTSDAEASPLLKAALVLLWTTGAGATLGAVLGPLHFGLANVSRPRSLGVGRLALSCVGRARDVGWVPAFDRGARLGIIFGLGHGLLAASLGWSTAQVPEYWEGTYLAVGHVLFLLPLMNAATMTLATVLLAVDRADAPAARLSRPVRGMLRWGVTLALAGAVAAMGSTMSAAAFRLPRLEPTHAAFGGPPREPRCHRDGAPAATCVAEGPPSATLVAEVPGTARQLNYRPRHVARRPPASRGGRLWVSRAGDSRGGRALAVHYGPTHMDKPGEGRVRLVLRPQSDGRREVVLYDGRHPVHLQLDRSLRVVGDGPWSRVHRAFDDFGVTLLVLPLPFLLAALLAFARRRRRLRRFVAVLWDEPRREGRGALPGRLTSGDGGFIRAVGLRRAQADGAVWVEGPDGARPLRLPASPFVVAGDRSRLVDGASVTVVGSLARPVEGGFRDGAAEWPADGVLAVGSREDAVRALRDEAAVLLAGALSSVGVVWLVAAVCGAL